MAASASALVIFSLLVPLIAAGPLSSGMNLGMIIPAGPDANCPDGCRCDEVTGDVTCRNVDFSMGDFYKLPAWTKALTLSRASIPTLFDRSFVTLRNLTSLTIQNSNLRSVEPNALMALSQLESLQLPSNQLKELPNAFFANSPNLRVISLTDNLITGLPGGLFDSCHLLKTLRLDQNSIRTLPGPSFAKLPFLEEVHVASNLLQELPASFLASASLRIVDVSFNAIRFVSPDAFITLPELTTLDLSHNLLTHVNPVSLISARKLTRVALDHNPLICDCQLAPLRAYWTSVFTTAAPPQMYQDESTSAVVPAAIDEQRSPTCAWPQQLNGIPITRVAASDFTCTTTSTTTTSTSTTTTTTKTTTTTAAPTTVTNARPTTTMHIWMLSGNDSTISFPSKASPNLPSPVAAVPVDVIIATVASIIAVMVTLSVVLAIICYRRRKAKLRFRQPRSIVVSTTPKRFHVGQSCKNGHLYTSTPNSCLNCNRSGNGSACNHRSSVGDVEKLGGDLLSSTSSASSSSGSASPPSGSTSIPSSHNCIFSTQQSGTMAGSNFQLMPDTLAVVTGSSSNGGLVQTVIDHLDYTNGVLMGAPHSYSLTRQHGHHSYNAYNHLNFGPLEALSNMQPPRHSSAGSNAIVDMPSGVPTAVPATVPRSESLV